MKQRSIASPSLQRNIVVGALSAGLSALVGLGVIPFQIRLLGAEGYGLISFFVTLQSVLMVFDLGMTATVNREVARSNSPENERSVAGMLGAMDRISWFLAIACIVVVAASAPMLARSWLNVVTLDVREVSQAMIIAGLLIAARWPTALYQSALLGKQRILLNSAINVTAVATSAVAGIAVLVFVAQDVRAYLLSQVAVGLVQLLVLRGAVSHVVLGRRGWAADFVQIRRVLRFSALTGLVTVIGVFIMQIDKLLLSKLLPLSELGYYSLAAVVASGVYVVTTPIFNAVYPRFSALIVAGKVAELEQLYELSSQLLVVLLVPLGITLAVFSLDLFSIWTGSHNVAIQVAPIAGFLVLGSTLHGVMFAPFALTLAQGAANLALKINLALLGCGAPLMIGGALLWGGIGAAAGWLLLHLLYLTAGSWATHSVLIPRLRHQWLVKDVALPVAASGTVGMIGATLVDAMEVGPLARLALAVAVWAACTGAAVAVSPLLRRWTFQRLVGISGA